jgi:ribonuclease P protein component
MTIVKYTYPSTEKLKSRKQIKSLFEEGKHVKTAHLRLIFLPFELADSHLKIGVSVSKRHFKLATDRNRIKRLTREAYRLNQHQLKALLPSSFVMMLIYQSTKMPTYNTIDEEFKMLLALLEKKLTILII